MLTAPHEHEPGLYAKHELVISIVMITLVIMPSKIENWLSSNQVISGTCIAGLDHKAESPTNVSKLSSAPTGRRRCPRKGTADDLKYAAAAAAPIGREFGRRAASPRARSPPVAA